MIHPEVTTPEKQLVQIAISEEAILANEGILTFSEKFRHLTSRLNCLIVDDYYWNYPDFRKLQIFERGTDELLITITY